MESMRYLKLLSILVVLLFMSTACDMNSKPPSDTNETKSNIDIISLRAITIGSEPVNGLDVLYEQLDSLTIEELGCTLRFDFIPWGDERKQLNVAIASGEYDFIPQGNFSDFRIMATKNAFLDLNEYLYLVPNLVEHYKLSDAKALQNYEIEGNLFGIPQYSKPVLSAMLEGFFYREDLRKEWGLEPVTDLDSMEKYLYRAKEDPRYKDSALITDNRIWTGLWFMLASDKYIDIVNIFESPFSVASINNPYRAISRMETPEFMEVLKYAKKWYKDGILEPQILSSSDNEGLRGLELMKADKKPCETNMPLWVLNRNSIPILYAENPEWEYEFYDYRLDKAPPYLLSTSSGGTTISVSSKTKYPETAIKLLEKAHTDKRYYDLLAYGVLGTHYNLDGDYINFIAIKNEDLFAGWTGIADDYLAYDYIYSINKQWQDNVYKRELESIKELELNAQFSPFNGFSLSNNEIITELNEMNDVKMKYFQPLLCGVTNNLDTDLAFAISKLKDAGLEEYLAEINKQLTEFCNRK